MSKHFQQTRKVVQYTVSALYLGTSSTGPRIDAFTELNLVWFFLFHLIIPQAKFSASRNTCNATTFVVMSSAICAPFPVIALLTFGHVWMLFLFLCKKKNKQTNRRVTSDSVFMSSVNCVNETSESIKTEEVQLCASGRDSLPGNAAAALRL